MGGRKGSSRGRLPRRRALLAALAAAALAVVVFPALSGADATVPPDVTATGATSVTGTGATLNGTVTLNDPDTDGSYTFSWGSSPGDFSLGSSTGAVGAGATDLAVHASVSSLTPATTYYYRVCAQNTFDTACDQQSFTTLAVAPTVSSAAAGSITPTSATLSGTVNPGGASTMYTFKWGTSQSSLPNSSGGTLGAGTSDQPVSRNATPLNPATTYWFELCADSTAGHPCTTPQSFVTPDKPGVATGGASAITANGATLAGTVTANGATVDQAYFEYGTTSSYGATWNASLNGSTAQATLGGLASGTTFHYALCAHNTWGLRCDSTDHTFKTDVPPTALLTENKTAPGPGAVSFDGSGSSDADGTIVSWTLDFGDGTSQNGSNQPGANIQHTYASVGSFTATLTVTDDQGATSQSAPVIVVVPSASIGDVSNAEGNSGTTNFVFPVTLSAKSTHDVTLDYTTADGTASAGSDYTSTAGTLKIPAGTDCTASNQPNAACQIPVPVKGDGSYEANETFTLTLSNPTGASITTATGTGTIVNDDQPPLLMIQSDGASEGNTGSVVSGAQTWSNHGNLQLADAGGLPATQGAHTFFISTPHSAAISGPYTYTGVSGNTLTGVSPGGSVSSTQIAFQPRFVTLSVLLCDPVQTPSGATSPSQCVSTTSGLPTTVQYSTSDGASLTTHIAVVQGQDYVAATGTLTIPAGSKSGPLDFRIIPNRTPENPANSLYDRDRWFNVALANAHNATIRLGAGSAHILDDDEPNPPAATTGAASSIDTDHATVSATVNPNGPATDVYVEYGPTDAYGTATAKQSLPAGSSDQTLSFPLTGLSSGTTYHYQVVATHDDGGAGYGGDATFKTDVPDVPPKAVLKANKTQASMPPVTVRFDGSGSSDPDGSIASWTLAFGDNTSTTGTGPVPSSIAHVYGSPCTCTASLTVTDNKGAQSTPATVLITVGKPQPTPGPLPEIRDYDTTAVGPKSATIVFTVVPNGAETRSWVEYGTAKSYGQMSPVTTIPAGAARTLTFPLAGLLPNTLYHFALFAAHADGGAVHSQDLLLKTPKLHYMSVTLKSKSVKATAAGKVSLRFYCRGNALPVCKGRVQLRLGRIGAGSASFRVRKGHSKLVSVRLKPSVLKRLLAGHGLRLVLSLSVQTGQGADLGTNKIMVLPPKARRS